MKNLVTIYTIALAVLSLVACTQIPGETGTIPNESKIPSTDIQKPTNDTGIEHEHIWNEATCISPKTCNNCGVTEGKIRGHNYQSILTPPTCTEQGYTTNTCLWCGHKYEGDYVAKFDHFFWDEVTKPSCNGEGYTTYTCLTCRYSYIDDFVEASGHEWIAATCIAPKACRNCAVSEGVPLGHEWTDSTCTLASLCNRCGIQNGAALGHDWIEATCKNPRSCARCGEISGDIASHNFINGICKECRKRKPSDGLWIVHENDIGYVVQGIGTCTDTDVVIPDTYNGAPVTGIHKRAFMEKTSLVSITIPDSVTTIGMEAFSECTNLISVIFGDNSELTTIGAASFFNCNHLENIMIPGRVKSIQNHAFSNCINLTSVYFPKSVVNIDESAFEGCYSLDNVAFEKNSILTNIGKAAFKGCNDLKYIDFPASVTSIDCAAFQACYLYSITFEENSQLTSIGENAFYRNSLTSIEIPNGVVNIGNSAFGDCNFLTYAQIPDTVTRIGGSVFEYCNRLESIVYCGNLEQLLSISFRGTWGSCSKLYINSNELVETVIIPSSITEINSALSCVSSLTTVTIPEGVTDINDYAFYMCNNLASVTIPSTVKSIGSWAFFYCTSLSSIKYEGKVWHWDEIWKGTAWNKKLPATEVICSNGTVKLEK